MSAPNLINTSDIAFRVTESQRQAVILALARLSVERPGWLMMLRELAAVFSGGEMFDKFRTCAGVPPMSVMDTSNQFGLVRTGDMVAVMHLDPMHGRHIFTLEEMINFTAWGATLADPDGKEFERVKASITK
jgi:hypothetical protein